VVKRSATLSDIAARAGCSKNTASLALRGSPRISEATRRKIRRIADRLGYIPNVAARNLSTRRSGLIGVYTQAVLDDVRSTLINRLLTGLHTAEYKPVLGLGTGHEGAWSSSPWLRTFRELNIEALVLAFTPFGRVPGWLRAVPTVLAGCFPTERPACDVVALDRTEAGAMGIGHLLERGHRRICVATGTQTDFGRACLATLDAAGLAPVGPLPADEATTSDVPAIFRACVAASPRPTAAIFADAVLAVHFLREALGRGLRVPEDVALIGYDYFAWADMLKIPLTTIEQPLEAMADATIALVRDRLADPALPRRRRVLPHWLAVRAST
jgi:DNA-binding LacI/PurR family transcriptional regulator